MKTNKKRRILLTSLAAGSGSLFVLPQKWSKPVINSVLLPAHAQTSIETTVASDICLDCTQNTFTAVAVGAQANVGGGATAPGPEGTFNIPALCIDENTTIVEMVATDNNWAAGVTGLEFDESLTITVSRPDSSSISESYTSWQQACSGTAVTVPVNSASWDVSALFTDASGAFICGNHSLSAIQCNDNARWAIRSFDFVVS